MQGKSMSDQSKNEREAVAGEHASDIDQSTEAPAQAGTEQTDDYEALVRLLKENEELKDRALRVAADMENLRRRTAREVQDARAYAVTNFARDMLAVSDNLRRAIEALPKEMRSGTDAGIAALVEGVEMTERAMLSTLERHGVKRLEPVGERFDPNFHQAMFEVPDENVAANTVVQVVQSGYSIGDRVLRPAMVGVSKGGPKQPPQASEPGPVNEQAEKDA
jgi:molecular chaperone GrpE